MHDDGTNGRSGYLPLPAALVGSDKDYSSSYCGWRARVWLYLSLTCFLILCSMAYVFRNHRELLLEAALTLFSISFSAYATGYSCGRTHLSILKEKATGGSAPAFAPASPRIILVERPAQNKMKQQQAEGVVDPGWTHEYVDSDEEEEIAAKGRLSRGLTFGSKGTDGQISFTRKSRHSSNAQQRFLGLLEWNCSTFDFAGLQDVAGKPILNLGIYLMDNAGLVHSVPEWMLRPDVSAEVTPKSELRMRVQNFFMQLDERYLAANPYHNSTHACDVMKNVKCFFDTELLRYLLKFREWVWFLSVMAAAIHDMGHTGQTNNFHIATRSDLALLYNDKSPLEQMHVSAAFQLMNANEEADWFGAFRKEYKMASKDATLHIQARFRRTLIAMVLATDNFRHNELVAAMGKLIGNDDIYKFVEDHSETQLAVLETILHGADISHPTYDLSLHLKWSSRVLEEFWLQGDLEKQVLGAASMPMFDRDKMDVPGAQVGFFKFIALGLWEPLSILLPEMDCRLQQMKSNLIFWNERKEAGLLELPNPEEAERDDDESKEIG